LAGPLDVALFVYQAALGRRLRKKLYHRPPQRITAVEHGQQLQSRCGPQTATHQIAHEITRLLVVLAGAHTESQHLLAVVSTDSHRDERVQIVRQMDTIEHHG
jgi:hypothetical protein